MGHFLPLVATVAKIAAGGVLFGKLPGWLHWSLGAATIILGIGSGVTEAACKTVFAERLKRSGMTWGSAGGQVILDLRVLVLSGVWHETHQAYLASRLQPTTAKPASYRVCRGQILEFAA